MPFTEPVNPPAGGHKTTAKRSTNVLKFMP